MIQNPSLLLLLLLSFFTLLKTQAINQPILVVRFFTDKPLELQETYKLLKQLNLEREVSVQTQQCTSQDSCEYLQLIDREAFILKNINLPASSSRLSALILQHIQNEKLQIEQQENKQYLKNGLSRLRLHSQISQMKSDKKLAYIHDWQKAHILKENKLIQAKIAKKAQNKKAEQVVENKPSLQSQVEVKNEPQSTQEDYFRWYLVYLVLILGLLIGMWYMHEHQQSIEAFSPTTKVQPASEQTEKLTSQ